MARGFAQGERFLVGPTSHSFTGPRTEQGVNPFFIYILKCADGSYYVGHTDDLEPRIVAHEEGLVSGYTRRRRPVIFQYAAEFPTRAEAIASERQIKGWSRAKKEALIRGDWDRIRELAKCRSAGEKT